MTHGDLAFGRSPQLIGRSLEGRPGMQLPRRIHIFGASGSGTTSLASAIAGKHGHSHLDTDDFFWVPTNPPFREMRSPDQRLALLRQALPNPVPWVLSGSLCGWGDPLIPEFDLVVFLVVPTPVRLARLRAREIARYGHHAIAPGGDLHQAHVEFLEWAGRYDTGGSEMRSRALHEAWLAALPGAVLRLEGDRSVAEQLTQITQGLTIEPLSDLTSGDIADLLSDSERFESCIVRRLVEEWGNGANRFDRPEEALFGARDAGRLVGVCGLNVDPYTGHERIGRVRHLYILSAFRRRGMGQQLVLRVIQAAHGRFDDLRLRTNNPAAARLYEALGFRPCDGDGNYTHVAKLATLPTRGSQSASP